MPVLCVLGVSTNDVYSEHAEGGIFRSICRECIPEVILGVRTGTACQGCVPGLHTQSP